MGYRLTDNLIAQGFMAPRDAPGRGNGQRSTLGVTTRGHCGAGHHLLLLRTARASGRAVVRADWMAS